MYRVPGAGGAVGAGAGALAFTGTDVTGWVLMGVILLVSGVAAVLASRRRRNRSAARDDETIS